MCSAVPMLYRQCTVAAIPVSMPTYIRYSDDQSRRLLARIRRLNLRMSVWHFVSPLNYLALQCVKAQLVPGAGYPPSLAVCDSDAPEPMPDDARSGKWAKEVCIRSLHNSRCKHNRFVSTTATTSPASPSLSTSLLRLSINPFHV